MKKLISLSALILSLCIVFCSCGGSNVINVNEQVEDLNPAGDGYYEFSINAPPYSGEPFVQLRLNSPAISPDEIEDLSFKDYLDLDELGRCVQAYVCLGPETMPDKERGSIGQVKPSGWHTVKYDSIDGKYLYNRCHLIGYQLSGENANEKNLITGTRYLNVEGMLPFENMVADYIKETGNHVLYMSTPYFKDEELVARGVNLQAVSVEDGGKAICFNVFIYNVQPGIVIDYSTGESHIRNGEEPYWPAETTSYSSFSFKKEDEFSSVSSEKNISSVSGRKNPLQFRKNYTSEEIASYVEASSDYVVNIKSKKYHLPSCGMAGKIKDENRKDFHTTKEYLEKQGYSPCKTCIK